MRDPSRIRPLLAELALLWETHPDQRFGQLFSNLVKTSESWYNIEDDEWLRRIRGTLDSGRWPRL